MKTLVDMLEARVTQRGGARAFTFVSAAAGEVDVTYAALDRRARDVAAALSRIARAGDRVLILHPPGLEFVSGFFGCLYAGMIAVPAFPVSRSKGLAARLASIAADAKAAVAMTVAADLDACRAALGTGTPDAPLAWLATDGLDQGASGPSLGKASRASLRGDVPTPAATGASLAYLQYTSGSTGTPKGVMVTHENLLQNLAMLHAGFDHGPDDVGVTWLPPFHDMGLIDGLLGPIFGGFPGVVMSPAVFLEHPLKWLDAISRHRGTHTAAPNFAYDLCIRRTTPEERAALDLSSWRVTINGAEPVRWDTMERFVDAFAASGFRRETFRPGYGLAEATLMVTGARPKPAPPRVKVVGGRTLVGCGRAALDGHVSIVDPTTRRLVRPGEVGEIWVGGRSVAQGYWGRPEESAETFRARIDGDDRGATSLRTGDLGFVDDGDLFITGRLKDLVIVHGRNLYPQDLELTSERAHAALRPGGGAAFSLEADGEERLVLVHEVERGYLHERRRSVAEGAPTDVLVPADEVVIDAICRAIAEEHEIGVHAIALIMPATLPKTSSGKVQRRACRAAFEAGELSSVVVWRAQAVAAGAHGRAATVDGGLRAALDAAPPEGRAGLLVAHVQERIAAALGLPPAAVKTARSPVQLGVDSLLAAELAAGLGASLGVEVPGAVVLTARSLGALAAGLLELPPRAAPLETRAASPAPAEVVDGRLVEPLSRGQRALWFVHRLDPQSAAYNVFFAVRITGALDVAALDAALGALVRRHAGLRTIFAASASGEPIALVEAEGARRVVLDVIDVAGCTPAVRDERVAESAHRPFDLTRGPLFRAQLFAGAADGPVLLLAFHHIVIDWWSLVVLMDELRTCYAAARRGVAPELPAIAATHADFVRWQDRLLAGPDGAEQLAYWQQKLAGPLPVLDLPTDRPRPPVQTHRGASFAFSLESALVARLRAFGREHDATLFMVLLTAFEAVLARISGQDDLLIGSPAAGRPRSDFQGTVGYFVQRLVLRADLAGDPSCLELLARVREDVLGAVAHQDHPFPVLVERLQQVRDPSRSPIYQVDFVLEKVHRRDLAGLASALLGEAGGRFDLDGAALESHRIGQRVSAFDLTLVMAEGGAGDALAGALVYNADLFDTATMLRLAGHFRSVLTAMLAAPTERVASLSLLTAAERREVLETWNRTAAPAPASPFVHELFSAAAARTPDALALGCGDVRMSHAELERRSNQLAHHLRGLGVGPDTLVGVLVGRAPELAVAFLAVLKAGGGYLPLDPAHPAARLSYMLDDARAPVLVTIGAAADELPETGRVVVRLDEDAARLAGEPVTPPPRGATPTSTAYVIYTSGSTGKPKGVVVQHHALTNLAVALAADLRVGPTSRVLQFCALGFDVSVSELAMAFVSGAALWLADRDQLMPGPALIRLLEDAEITVLSLPASSLAACPAAALPALATLVVGGEAASAEVVRRWSAGRHFLNCYGPTETTVTATLFACSNATTRLPIGTPIRNVRAYVLDRRLEPVPIGVAGELVLGGEGVARGYLARAELTASAFLPDPFAGVDGARMFRTGDVVRRAADGTLSILGRADDQVKIRGFRVELGEIEAVLAGHLAVAEVVVVTREVVQGDKQLVAYVVGKDGPPAASDLKAWVAARLPEFMVPSAFVALDAMPLLSSGKLDRRALPAPGHVVDDARVAPRTPTEVLLARIWCELLGVPELGIHDDFFDVGGHSLLATQLTSRVHAELGIELPLRSLFDAPTIARYAEQLEQARREQHHAAPAIERIARDRALPLSFAQERLWFVSQLEPDSAAYNVPGQIRLRGALDVGALERSLGAILSRHEVLRTVFAEVDGRSAQVILPTEGVLRLPVTDLSALAPAARDARVTELARAEARRPFALATGPLLRATLLRLAPEDHVLFLVMHHVVSDGWSVGILVRELSTFYRGFRSGQPASLPELPIQYADYASWQRAWFSGDGLDDALAYWTKKLAGMPPALELPTDRPRPPVQSDRGANLPVVIPRATIDALTRLCRAEGATLYMAVLAGYQALLSRYTGQLDVAVGSPIAGRNHPEIEGLIGFFVNTLVMRTDLSGAPTFRELLGRVRGTTLEAFAHQELPFEKLVDALEPVRDLSRKALVQVVLTFQTEGVLPELDGLGVSLEEVDSGTAKTDLLLEVGETPEGLVGMLRYSTDLFERASMVRFAGHLNALLAAAAEAPDRSIAGLPLLGPAEVRELDGWNATRVERDDAATLHGMIEAQAARTPDAIAVACEARTLTYRELDRRATALAVHLAGFGVGPETLVGICAERSIELAIALLGVLKSGAAYLPLDPSYPPDRLGYMLDDAGAVVLLTHGDAADDLPDGGRLIVAIAEASIPAGPAEKLPATPSVPVAPDGLAYVIYTSGSTGLPKGAMNTHRGITNYVSWLRRTFPLAVDDRVLQQTSISFDISGAELYWPLVCGATLVFARPDGHKDLEYMAQVLADERITATHFVPSTLRLLLEQPAIARATHLRSMITGGEALSNELAARFHAVLGADLHNLYGPTETAVDVTSFTCERDGQRARIPIGRPIANTQVHILDRGLERTPVGVFGEVHVGGFNVGRGYHRRPELTAEKFIPDPFASGGRLYRTGDLACWRADGTIEFAGRLDHQVKVRGYRIELGEIEAVLARLPAVLEVVVIVREDVPGDRRLTAYVTMRPGHEFAAAELRASLKEKLPDYMVPSAIVLLDAIPVTPNGKVDLKALPEPGVAVVDHARVAPTTPAEIALAAVWAQVLRVPEVGIHDNFFELGGDSILVIQVISRASAAGFRFTPWQLFEHQTIASLAAVAGTAASVESEQGMIAGDVPLTPILRWFVALASPAPSHYNQALLLEVRGGLAPELIEQMVKGLPARHDALRLRLRSDAGGAVALTCDGNAEPLALERVDLSGLPPAERADALRTAAARLQGSLDLAAGPIVRAALFELGEGAAPRLLIVIHHMAVDGVSWRILLDDLAAHADALARGAAPPALGKTTSFRRWAERLAAHARTPEAEAELAYWCGVPDPLAAAIPVDGAGVGPGPTDETRTHELTVALSAADTEALIKEVPRAYRTQVNDVLLTALAQAFARSTGRRTLQVDLEGHGREALFEDVDLSRTVGWFTSVYPVRIDLGPDASPGAELRATKERLRAVPRGGVGYGILRYLGRPEIADALAALPPSRVLFNYLGQLDTSLGADARFGPAPEGVGASHSPLTPREHVLEIGAAILSGRLEVTIRFDDRWHHRATVQALADGYVDALRALVRHCLSAGAGGYSTADFPLAGLDRPTLERLVGNDPDVEDVYPLSVMQEGMLFETIYTPENRGLYFEQLSCLLEGELDPGAFERAWLEVMRRHPILRTQFAWRDLPRFLQIVRRTAPVPHVAADWRGTSDAEQARRLIRYVADDRAQGMDLEHAPLMRYALFQVGERAHRFVWTNHHLLLDGWSLPILFGEVFACHEAFRRGETPVLPSVRPYRDYIAWLGRQDLGASERFWRAELAGFVGATKLSIDRVAPGLKVAKGEDGFVRRSLPLELAAGLERMARAHQLTVNTLLVGAWSLLVARHGETEDVVLGTTVAGRPPSLPGIEGAVGLFINTVPLRVAVPASASIVAWLKGLQARTVAVRAHEHAPLGEIQRWSEVPAGEPMFETLFVFENYPMDDALLSGERGFRVSEVEVDNRAKFPMTASAKLGASPIVEISFDRARFELRDVERLLAQFAVLLDGIAAVTSLEQRVSTLTLLAEAERRTILDEWNRTSLALPEACVHELFEAQVRRTPGAIATSFDGETLTYGQLNARANRIAHHLRALGVGPDVLVGVCLERSTAMVVTILAILKAGGAYLPLDPDYPQDRLSFMLADARARLLVTDGEIARRLAFDGVTLVILDGLAATLDRLPVDDPSHHTLRDHLAYVVYTSGSTGTPKGVCVPHRGIVRLFSESFASGCSSLRPDDRVAQASTAVFDAITFELYGALLTGATLVGVSKNTLLSPALLAAKLRDDAITSMFLTTAVAQQLATEVPGIFSGMHHVIFGGEASSPRVIRALIADGGPERLVHAYGPTECTTFATVGRLLAVPDDARSLPIGRPIPNTTAYVLDPALEPVPVGMAGELYLGGDGLARGYLGRPDLTAERFVPDPTGSTPGARLYRTGDRVRWLADGSIDFVGRVDHQVKVRGFRIELGEIEAALVSLPEVREAIVTVREDAPGDKRIVAYVVPTEGQRASRQELRARLATHLPEYMVPSAFVELEEFPLNRNGKVDRSALPRPEASSGESVRVTARTPVEGVVAQIWSSLLDVPMVGVDADFFDLGGHSLIAVQVLSRVRSLLKVALPIRSLFAAPLLGDFAAAVQDAIRKQGGTTLPTIAPTPPEETSVASFGQERLWFLSRLEPDSAAYNVAGMLRLRGALERDALARAFGEIIRRHEVLRTTFREVDGRAALVLHAPKERIDLPCLDLRNLRRVEQEVRLKDLGQVAFRAPFDLARGPLVRLQLVQLDDAEHALILTMHHIVADGWSIGVLVRELATLYAAYQRGGASPLPELAIQYRDYARWQRSWFGSAGLDLQLGYWTRQLAGAPVALELPTDRPRPPVPSGRGASVLFALPKELSDRLARLSRAESATLYMTMLAAMNVVLARYSGQRDILVGSPIANRARPEVEPLIGYFVNTFVMRTDLSGDPTFRELLARVRTASVDAYTHGDVPFDKLVEELRPERDLSRPPLFQVQFAITSHDDDLRLEGLDVTLEQIETGTALFDLALDLRETDQGITGELIYNTDIFERERVERFLRHYQTVLTALAVAPETSISKLPLLSADERKRVLIDWNQTDQVFPDALWHELFEGVSARTPDAVAAADRRGPRSFRQLNGLANRLAGRLVDRGVGPDVVVGLLAERSLELLVGILAVHKAGGAYLGLDPRHPPQRLAQIIELSGTPLVLVTPELEDALSSAIALVPAPPTVGSLGGTVDDGPLAPDLRRTIHPASLAYVIFTSGSTGVPKAAMLEHRGMVNHLHSMIVDAEIVASDRIAQTASQSFDTSVWQFLAAIGVGAQVRIFEDAIANDPGALIRAVVEHGITILESVPSVIRSMLDEQDAAPGLRLTNRLMISIGEALPPELARRWFGAYPAVPILNAYGPAECSDGVCHHELRVPLAPGERHTPVGRPIVNMRAYVLDAGLAPVPEGVPGELYIGGVGVGRGYLADPGRTAPAFLPDPFADRPGVRMYRTGDVVRHLRGGVLEFQGRADHQVKVRGLRIELGEIEAVLRQLPEVREAVVIAREDVPGAVRLVGYWLAGAGADPSALALKQHARAKLPEYMVPSAFVLLEVFPLTASGKLDRRALPAPAVTGRAELAAPRTPIQEVVTQIMAGVLGVETVDVDDDFFELGGHSLTATRIMARTRAAFGVDLPLRVIFEAPTSALLAARVEEALRQERGGALPPPLRAARSGATTLSFGQERLWFLHRLEPESIAYNMPGALRLRGRLDPRALTQALRELVRRHEVLRTTFTEVDGRPSPVVAPDADVDIPLVDLSASSAEARATTLRDLERAEFGRPFELARGPLFHAMLVRLGADEHILLATMHHIVADGWSMGVMLREVTILYAAFCRGDASPLPDLTFQYADYARWQKAWLSGATLTDQLGYWTGKLGGHSGKLELPTDHARPPVPSGKGAIAPVAFSRRLTDGLRELSRAEGATLYMTLLAGLQVLLGRYAGQDDVLVGAPVANRNPSETESLIGYFANTLALRTDLSGDPSFRELLARVRSTSIEAYTHQDVPFEKIVEALRLERDLSRTPLFQVLFALQNTPAEPFSLAGLEVSEVDVDGGAAMFDLSVYLSETDDGLRGQVIYNTDLFERPRIERMLAHLELLLEGAVAAPGTSIASLPLLGAGERALLAAWNRTAIERPRSTLPARFEAQVALTPDAEALTFEGRTLSYAELDRRANQLAHELRSRGVGPEVRVGVLLERSLELVVSLLAVLKAGGAYVPLDVIYPRDRIAFVLEDAHPAVLITDSSLADWSAHVGSVIHLDAERAALAQRPSTAPPSRCAPDALAYVIYTSGSTGKPKGVQVTHGSVLNLFDAMLARTRLGGEDTFFAVTTVTFDIAGLELLMPLLVGARVAIASSNETIDAVAMIARLKQTGATAMQATPATWRFLVDAGWGGGLRVALCGGEAFPRPLAQQLRSRAAELWNVYGPTETAIWSSALLLDGAGGAGAVPIAGPLDNQEFLVLDRRGGPVPIGVPGELCIGGQGVARGYLGRPALTAERFIPHPEGAGARIYRTGDLVRWRVDGTLEFLGRTDHQVKIRGFRIELGEIEAVLAGLPGVQSATVVVREESAGNPRLIAYWVHRGVEAQAVPAMDDLRAALLEALPEYMVPSVFVLLDRMPLTPNGKVDRAALPAPSTIPEATGPQVQPRTPTEVELAKIWRAVLGVEQLGVLDDFFRLGGHSLLATQIISRVSASFGIDVPVRTIYEAPTIAAFARRIDETPTRGDDGRAPAIVPRARRPRSGSS